MKNIWKNAIYLVSLIGLMTFVSSCDSSSDPDPDTPTSATYKSTSIVVENVNPVPAIESEISIIIESTGAITVSGIDTSWGLKPTGFVDGSYTVESFNALGWTSGSVSSDASASTVVLVYDENALATPARVKGLLPKYTYTFARQ